MNDFQQRREDIVFFLVGGVPARTAAAWLSAVDRAEQHGLPCPTWDELEKIAPSITPRSNDISANYLTHAGAYSKPKSKK